MTNLTTSTAPSPTSGDGPNVAPEAPVIAALAARPDHAAPAGSAPRVPGRPMARPRRIFGLGPGWCLRGAWRPRGVARGRGHRLAPARQPRSSSGPAVPRRRRAPAASGRTRFGPAPFRDGDPAHPRGRRSVHLHGQRRHGRRSVASSPADQPATAHRSRASRSGWTPHDDRVLDGHLGRRRVRARERAMTSTSDHADDHHRRRLRRRHVLPLDRIVRLGFSTSVRAGRVVRRIGSSIPGATDPPHRSGGIAARLPEPGRTRLPRTTASRNARLPSGDGDQDSGSSSRAATRGPPPTSPRSPRSAAGTASSPGTAIALGTMDTYDPWVDDGGDGDADGARHARRDRDAAGPTPAVEAGPRGDDARPPVERTARPARSASARSTTARSATSASRPRRAIRAELLDESLAILDGLWTRRAVRVRGTPLPLRADDLPADARPAAADPDLGRRRLAARAVDAADASLGRGRRPGRGADQLREVVAWAERAWPAATRDRPWDVIAEGVTPADDPDARGRDGRGPRGRRRDVVDRVRLGDRHGRVDPAAGSRPDRRGPQADRRDVALRRGVRSRAMSTCPHLWESRAVPPPRPSAPPASSSATSGSTSAQCLTCGNVGCCDMSVNKHASAPFRGDAATRSPARSSPARPGAGATPTRRWTIPRSSSSRAPTSAERGWRPRQDSNLRPSA